MSLFGGGKKKKAAPTPTVTPQPTVAPAVQATPAPTPAPDVPVATPIATATENQATTPEVVHATMEDYQKAAKRSSSYTKALMGATSPAAPKKSYASRLFGTSSGSGF
jgi:hypothetical protein